MRKIFSKRSVIVFVFASLMGSTIYLAVRILLAPSALPEDGEIVRIKSDYTLMFGQCLLGTVAMILPSVITKRINLTIPSNMIFVYTLFMYCAVYLGEVRYFYYHVPHWDTLLHTFSGAMLGALGFSVICLLNKTDSIPFVLSPMFVAVFSFCFAVSLGVFWEIYEFTLDFLFDMNMQKYALESGEQLVGQYALIDTMKDLMVDCIGAFVMSGIGYVSLKLDKGWIDKMIITKNVKK